MPVSAIGDGCMWLTRSYGPAAEGQDMIRLIRMAFAYGVTFFDTST